MDSKQIGLAAAAIGAVLIVYELYFSFCSSRVDGLCYFPFSPSGPGTGLPWYSLAILAFGLLVYFGTGSQEPQKEEP